MARYRSAEGFYLWASFDPFDGQSAALRCGRRWHYESKQPGRPGYDQLSNYYSVLAKTFGFELPSYYALRPADAIRTIDMMLDDLKSTMPTVLENVTLDHLVAIESQKYGCQWAEDTFSGSSRVRARLEEISRFPEQITSPT